MSSQIRVLHVVTHMNRGGLETMLMNYYRHIDREMIQFDFLVHREARADYDDEIEAMGGRIYRLPRLNPWSMRYLQALDTFFMRHPEYRIVHVHQDCMSGIVLKAAQKRGVPVRIAHSHSSSQDKDLKYPVKLFYKRTIRQYATDLMACGKTAGRWMFGCEEFTVLYNSIDTVLYQFDVRRAQAVREKLNIPEDTLVLGHVGRFNYPKNHKFLLEIFREVHIMEPNSVLLLVGDGELRKRIEEKVINLGLVDCVIFTGVRSDVPELMQAMDVLVFPSIYEGLPVVLIEAQAAGLPCCISKNIPEECIVTDRITRHALTENASVWAQEILSHSNMARMTSQKDFQRFGYDIHTNVVQLQEYYIKRYYCGEETVQMRG